MFVRRKKLEVALAFIKEQDDKIALIEKRFADKAYRNAELVIQNETLRKALRDIAAKKTEYANSTVKNMHRIAVEALAAYVVADSLSKSRPA